eukprot:gene5877-8134_t
MPRIKKLPSYRGDQGGGGGGGGGGGQGADHDDPEVRQMLQDWKRAKAARDYEKSDGIREQLRAKGVEPRFGTMGGALVAVVRRSTKSRRMR